MKRKICVVTGTRAEYGLLNRLMRLIMEADDTRLQLIVTNMHLSQRFGNTYKEIEDDGFHIDRRVPIIEENADDSPLETVFSMSRALNGFAKAYDDLQPDLLLLLGDRHEILAAATAALIERIPIAHIHGGEITEGAYDDAVRHAVTKMSHLHFPATETYRKRIIQLGEQPDHVFCVGALGVENLRRLSLPSKEEIEQDIRFTIDDRTVLATYHPVTRGTASAADDIRHFLEALHSRENLRIIFTMPNSDAGNHDIAEAIRSFVQQHPDRSKAFDSLGQKRYFAVMRQTAAVIGNSSSGLLETPSFGIPTLNIGDRQKGRIACESVFNCSADSSSILQGLDTILAPKFRNLAKQVHNPYEKEGTAQAIFDVIRNFPLDSLSQKHFYDIPS
ncbi:MAG: UDP-N-acetylglucosamine 2-epimerase (hydrolyzing) [Paludibacteraceae bacterium]|nr:UDP-N-acetylglucosamine 2-epimerase (hydrolyzing) [Paludibacteraceae bacterium]